MTKNEAMSKIYELKAIPQTTGSIEATLQSIDIHIDQIIDPTVYN